MTTTLWYTHPADEWQNGLPIGTGRLAAMVLGTVDSDRLALNHEWLWRGVHQDRDTDTRSHLLAEVRQLLLAGNYAEGTLKGNQAFGSFDGKPRQPRRVDPYQPAGDLCFRLDHGDACHYRRELDLDRAIVTVAYQADGVRFRREYLASIAHDVILVHLTADQPFGGEFWLSRIEDPGCSLRHGTESNILVMDGQFDAGMAFRVGARIHSCDGEVTIQDNRLVVRKAREILVAVNIGTSAGADSPADECAGNTVPHTDWDKLLGDHEREYRKLYDTLKLTVDVPESTLPTDERLQAARDGNEDPALPLLYFNYGRYLMVASTATADLPPNLQGKWNEKINPPWNCDYHHDVNLQMNYWQAEAGHLQFATDALFRHIERFIPHARKVAKDLYGCEGVYFPIQTDPWGRSTPESFGWAVWIGAAAWLAQHMWWHYEYGQDLTFLRDRAYPFFKDVAAFYESYLIEDENGVLQVVPSQSPENVFIGGGSGDMVSLCVSATLDVQLIQDVLGHAIQSAELLTVDAEKRRQWQSILDRLPPMKVGKHGQLQEWNEDFEEMAPEHRHNSHLFGLYPGDLITPDRTPELWQAARVSIERRMAHGSGKSGWSRAWASCLFARLGDSKNAWDHLMHMVLNSTTDSLLGIHPPQLFQIDGNFGGPAIVLEMLLQSYHEELHFLPALPAAWPDGTIRGLRARGGYAVDLRWNAGLLTRAEVTPIKSGVCTILHAADQYKVVDVNQTSLPCRREGHRIRFEIKAGQEFVVLPID